MNNIIKISLLGIFTLLTGCAHEANIVSLNKKINLPALKPEHPVIVYTEKPDFGYEIVCEAKIKDSGYYAKDVLSYEKVAKEQVRACGTELAYVKDFYHETFKVGTTYHYNKYSKTVYASNDYRSYSGASILGIRRNTDSAKIINDMPSKLGLAMGVDNVKVFRTLLKGLSKNPKQMSPDDHKLLQLSLHMNASDGLNCPKKIVNELTDKYNIKLNFIEAKPFPDSKIMLPKDMIFCESVLVKSFDNFEDRLALMLYISKKSHELLENPSSKESKKIQYLKKPVNLAMQEINNACNIDASSKLCILKDTFVELQHKLA